MVTLAFVLSRCQLVAGVAVAAKRPRSVDTDAIRTDSLTRFTLVNI